MNKLNMKEFEETFKARLIKRNQPLFDLLSALEGHIPAPAIDFDTEDGGVEFVWTYGDNSIYIYMEKKSSKYGVDYTPTWMVIGSSAMDCKYGYHPTPEFIKEQLDILFSK